MKVIDMVIIIGLFLIITLPLIVSLIIYITTHKKFRDGGRYHGRIRKGIRDGFGEMMYPDGSVYKGYWSNDKRWGNGQMKYSNGDFYEGKWKSDTRWGTGEYTWADGRHYSGEWTFGQRCGKGRMKWPNHQVYVGNWGNDVFDGKGILLYPDESESIGIWKDGKLITGKYIPCRRGDGALSYFLKKGEINSAKESLIKDGNFRNELCIQVPYGSFHIVAYIINKRKIFSPDKHYIILGLGPGQPLFNFITNIINLKKLYTDQSVDNVISTFPVIKKILFSEPCDYQATFEKIDGDFCIKIRTETNNRFNQTHLNDYLKNSIISLTSQVQDLVHELNHFSFDVSLLEIDPIKEEKLKSKAELIANVKYYSKMIGKKVAIGAAMAGIAYITGQVFDFDLPSEESFGGDMPDNFSGLDYSEYLPNNEDLSLVSDVIVPVADITDISDFDISGQIPDITSNINGIDVSSADLPNVDSGSIIDLDYSITPEDNAPIANTNISFGNHYDDNTAEFLSDCRRHGIDIPSSVDHSSSNNCIEVDRHSAGGLLSIDKSIIDRSINDAFKAGKISEDIKSKLLSELRRC